ncbi:MAG: hypothetical protein ABL953_14860, partial [Ilumatobacteraceae bacterium]
AVFDRFASPKRAFAKRDAVMALYAPISLVLLPGVWVMLMILGFTAIFWGTGIDPLTEAFVTSGSSLLTLGFVRPDGIGRVMLTFFEAGLGLGIVSLLISYLPTIYGAFSRREALVGMLEVRAGLPPSPAELLTRYQTIGWIENIDADLFEPWEEWFVDVEESHTTQPSLVFFRSPHPERNWLTAAGCVLDTAAIVASTLDVPRSAQRDILLRGGFFTLRRIADFYGIEYDPAPAPTDPISVTQREFDLLCVELRAAGIPLKKDLQQAWLDYAGWRVNYDAVLVALCALVMAPPARWSSDRMPERHHKPPWFPGRASRR